MELGDGVGFPREAEAADGHVERVAAYGLELVAVEPVARAHFHEAVERVLLVAGEDGRVRREDDLVACGSVCVAVARAVVHLLTDQLEGGEEGVALVEVVHVHVEAERAEGADAADAEYDFLRHAVLVGAAVEPVRNEGLGVAGKVRVEEVERGVAEGRRLPDLAAHVLIADRDRHLDARVLDEFVGVAVGAEDGCGLARIVEGLVAVAPPPFQPDSDEGQVEVVGALEVVAGEDAEATGVGLELGVEPVLHTEVRDALGTGRHKQAGDGEKQCDRSRAWGKPRRLGAGPT